MNIGIMRINEVQRMIDGSVIVSTISQTTIRSPLISDDHCTILIHNSLNQRYQNSGCSLYYNLSSDLLTIPVKTTSSPDLFCNSSLVVFAFEETTLVSFNSSSEFSLLLNLSLMVFENHGIKITGEFSYLNVI